jgi:hypothetical protein
MISSSKAGAAAIRTICVASPLHSQEETMWTTKANKYYRGRTDRMTVSLTESCAVDEFIEQFLRANELPAIDSNRERIASAMTQYPTRALWRQDDVARFVRRKMNI